MENTTIAPKNMKNDILEDITTFFESEKYYFNVGISYKRGYLFAGSPGTGKTSFIFTLANHLQIPIYHIEKISDSGKSMSSILCQIKENSIVWIDEVDELIEKTRDENENTDNGKDDGKVVDKKKKLSLSEWLHFLDGYGYFHKCVLIFTTNYPEKLDKALKRPGRIDRIFEFELFGKEQIQFTIEKLTNFNLQKNRKWKSIPDSITISPAYLTNVIVIPNRNNLDRILELLKKKFITGDNPSL